MRSEKEIREEITHLKALEAQTVEDMEEAINEGSKYLDKPILGQNYIDYHNENDECCVRIMYPSKQFDIIIKEVNVEDYFT